MCFPRLVARPARGKLTDRASHSVVFLPSCQVEFARTPWLGRGPAYTDGDGRSWGGRTPAGDLRWNGETLRQAALYPILDDSNPSTSLPFPPIITPPGVSMGCLRKMADSLCQCCLIACRRCLQLSCGA